MPVYVISLYICIFIPSEERDDRWNAHLWHNSGILLWNFRLLPYATAGVGIVGAFHQDWIKLPLWHGWHFLHVRHLCQKPWIYCTCECLQARDIERPENRCQLCSRGMARKPSIQDVRCEILMRWPVVHDTHAENIAVCMSMWFSFEGFCEVWWLFACFFCQIYLQLWMLVRYWLRLSHFECWCVPRFFQDGLLSAALQSGGLFLNPSPIKHLDRYRYNEIQHNWKEVVDESLHDMNVTVYTSFLRQ